MRSCCRNNNLEMAVFHLLQDENTEAKIIRHRIRHETSQDYM